MLSTDTALERGFTSRPQGHGTSCPTPFWSAAKGSCFKIPLSIYIGRNLATSSRLCRSHLCKVVGAEREEIGFGSYLVSRKCCTWYLIMVPVILYGSILLCKHLLNGFLDDILCALNSCTIPVRGTMISGCLDTLFFQIDGSLDDGTGLHLGDFGIEVAQTTTA